MKPIYLAPLPEDFLLVPLLEDLTLSADSSCDVLFLKSFKNAINLSFSPLAKLVKIVSYAISAPLRKLSFSSPSNLSEGPPTVH